MATDGAARSHNRLKTVKKTKIKKNRFKIPNNLSLTTPIGFFLTCNLQTKSDPTSFDHFLYYYHSRYYALYILWCMRFFY